MRQLLLLALLILDASHAYGASIQELSYRKTFTDLNYSHKVSSFQLDGFRYKSLHNIGQVLAGYEIGMAAAQGAHSKYGSASYLATANYGFTASTCMIATNNIGVGLNSSLGLEYLSASDSFPLLDGNINVYLNLGPSLYVPIQSGKFGISYETYFSNFEKVNALQGKSISFFILSEF